jgi:hypothetical protein
VHFDVDHIYTGAFGSVQCGAAPAAGQMCTLMDPLFVTPDNPLGLQPFEFMNFESGSSVMSFGLSGILTDDLSPGTSSPFHAIFTAQFDDPYQAVLATLISGGTVSASYSASFFVEDSPESVPEPATLLLLGSGLLLFLRRRRIDRL